jgi:carbon storage regulator
LLQGLRDPGIALNGLLLFPDTRRLLMLVLSRRRGEQIVLPGLDVVLTVVEISRDRVRLGITAPREVPVFRDEIWQQVGASHSRAPERLQAVRQGGTEQEASTAALPPEAR